MAGTQEDALLLPPFTVPVGEPERLDSAWKVGKYTFRADFDSANLGLVKQGPTPSEFHLWTKRDCQDTDHERGTRSWFYFGVSGQQAGDFIVMTIMNLNKQGKLFSQDYRPWCWSQALAEWQPMTNKVSYKREGDDFQLRFSQKFEGADEMFFAFAIPFSYRDTQAMLDRISYTFQNYQTIPPECISPSGVTSPESSHSSSQDSAARAGRSRRDSPACSQIYFNRQLLARSIQGRHVDIITITDCYGASEESDPLPVAAAVLNRPRHWVHDDPQLAADLAQPVVHFPGKKVFFVSARVHPGETPATHMFNGILSFLLRQHDARAAALRRIFVFKLVPIVNPDGVYHGFYRTDTLGQNLNRYYLGNPDRELQPSVWAIKRQLMHYVSKGSLEFYLDLHAHANKKGVFIYGNALDSERALASLLYARLIALNSPVFDFMSCNYTEKNMSRADKDGISKEGAARVALFKETGLTHLYTIEANYNTARVLNVISPAQGDHNGRASPPSGRRFPPKFATPILQQVGRAFVVAALDLKSANPWSRVPACEHRSLEGAASWITSVSRSPTETRLQHLPALSESCVDSLRALPNCLLLDSLGLGAAAAAAVPTQQQSQQQSQQGGSWTAAQSRRPRASFQQQQQQQGNGSESSPCSSAVSISTQGGGTSTPGSGYGGYGTPTSSTPTPYGSFYRNERGEVQGQGQQQRPRSMMADGTTLDFQRGPDSPALPAGAEQPGPRRSSASNTSVASSRRPVYLPSIPASSPIPASAYTNLVPGATTSASSIPSYSQGASQQSATTRELSRSTSMPVPARASMPAPNARLQSLARVPSGIPRPPGSQAEAQQGAGMPNHLSQPNGSSEGSRCQSDTGETASQQPAAMLQHMGSFSASTANTVGASRWYGRVRSGRHVGQVVSQVPLTSQVLKLSEPVKPPGAEGMQGSGLQGNRAKSSNLNLMLAAGTAPDGDCSTSAAALVLATAPWQAHGTSQPRDVGDSSAAPGPVTPRLHTRLLAALPPTLQQLGQPVSESLDGVVGRSTGIRGPDEGTSQVTSTIDPVLSNLKVVGTLPAFKSTGRRRMVAGI